MNRTFEDIINEGRKNGSTISEINAELKAAGANFHLDPDGRETNWTEQEMAEGFNAPEKPAEDVVHLQDCFKRDSSRAGQTIRVCTAEGQYDITYDESGYAFKAVRA